MSNEAILDVPHNFYHTWHKSLEWFLERPGREGRLCTRIADLLSSDGYDGDAIVATLNCAYRNCIAICLMRLPQYNYNPSVRQAAKASGSWGHSLTDQCITQILLAARPEAKKSEGIRKLLAHFDQCLYPEELDADGMSGLKKGLRDIRRNVEETDIDFSPCPDMLFVRNDIESGKVDLARITGGYDHGRVRFLIGLMPSKEDKLYLLDRIDEAYQARKTLPF